MSNVLVLTPDVLGLRMAGPAIRAWEISRELAKTHKVRLVSVTGVPVERTSDEFQVIGEWKDSALKNLVRWADVVIVQGAITTEFSWILRTPAKLVVDLYDPMHLETLEQTVDRPIQERYHMVAAIGDTLDVQIRRADFMLCASTKQRDFWLGQLMANGRVNPYTYDVTGTLSNLLAIVPFGLSEEPPRRSGSGMKGIVPGISADDEVIIWGGGIYNWFDPLTLVRAMQRVVAVRPKARLFFMGSGHPNPDVPQMSIARDAYELAETLGLLNSVVFFNEGWVPYEARANYLLDADIGVSTHAIHLETEFSFRTRILDYLWSGLPIVATEGDGFAELIRDHQLGAVVPGGDEVALAEAILGILSSPSELAQVRKRVASTARDFEWGHVLAPLVQFCDAPKYASDRQAKRRLWHTSPTMRSLMSSLRHGRLRPAYRFARVTHSRIRKLVLPSK